jgi:phage tail sheath protein FI
MPPIFSEADIYQVQSGLIQQCEKRRDRIALLDPPFKAARNDRLGVGAVRAWRSRFDSKYAAFYYPWLRVVDPLRSPTSLTRDIPPSGHVAGQYAQNDFQFGVHKAPANAPLVWTQDVTIPVNDEVQGVLNPLGINAIRPLTGRGIRIFGARTVSSDSDWRFVNVRRLLMMIEKAIDVATQWAVFEPNDVLTRAKLHLSLTSFLLSLWQRGALMGATAAEAFFVKCDEETNPPTEREQGRMLAVVGVAPSQPFEFIILRVGRANNQFEITEATSIASASGVF